MLVFICFSLLEIFGEKFTGQSTVVLNTAAIFSSSPCYPFITKLDIDRQG